MTENGGSSRNFCQGLSNQELSIFRIFLQDNCGPKDFLTENLGFVGLFVMDLLTRICRIFLDKNVGHSMDIVWKNILKKRRYLTKIYIKNLLTDWGIF